VQPFTPTEQDLIYDWAEKWIGLIDLINNVTGSDEVSEPPPPPTLFDEFQYISLRSWLLNHQEQFIPLWSAFYVDQDWSLNPTDINEYDGIPNKYLQNPFSLFYEAENLYRLAHQLELQNDISIWEPDEYVLARTRPVFLRLAQLSMELIDLMER